MSEFGDYKKEIMDAAHNEKIGIALYRAINSFRGNIDSAMKKFPHTVKLAQEAREIKARSVGEMRKLADIAC